jgi:lipopolysaccharide transport system ATP-binding protein
LARVEIFADEDLPTTILRTGGPARFVFQLDRLISGLETTFVIHDELGQAVATFKSENVSPDDMHDPAIGTNVICEIDELMLMAGRYRLNVLIRGGSEWQDFIESAAYFDVEGGQLRGRPMPPPAKKRASACMPHRWILPQ